MTPVFFRAMILPTQEQAATLDRRLNIRGSPVFPVHLEVMVIRTLRNKKFSYSVHQKPLLGSDALLEIVDQGFLVEFHVGYLLSVRFLSEGLSGIFAKLSEFLRGPLIRIVLLLGVVRTFVSSIVFRSCALRRFALLIACCSFGFVVLTAGLNRLNLRFLR